VGLDEHDVDPDPLIQFQHWYAAARAAGEAEPDAMTLATVAADGAASSRWVLLKGVGPGGLVFFTNARSRKGVEMAANPKVALGFRWPILQRQVRVSGVATPVGAAESDAYFASRSRGAQIGAWASAQSTVLAGRGELDARVAEVTARYANASVPRPPWWGGWRVRPDVVEFWQARPDRLHDRLRYRHRDGDASTWVIERLSP
jgi:pyridoxamine 5'-phosphate oxidase